MNTPANTPLTAEQIDSLAAKAKLDEHYLEEIEFCLSFIKNEKMTLSDKKDLINLITEDVLSFAKEPCINATCIGVTNVLLKKLNASNKGMLEHLHWLAMDRVLPDAVLATEHLFCAHMAELVTSWTQAFLLAHNPEGLVEFRNIKQKKMERRLGLHPMRSLFMDEGFRRRDRGHESQALSKAKANFKSMHKPAPEGTVKELAAKYGVSLSEIRRRKQEGTLHELG